jgi:hypothetical protein
VDTQYFFPASGTKVWAEQQKLAEAVSNISLFINRNGTLEYHCFLDSVPHEWTQNTATEFEAGTLVNAATRAYTDIISLPTKKYEHAFDSYEELTNFIVSGGLQFKENTYYTQDSHNMTLDYVNNDYWYHKKQVMNAVSAQKVISGADIYISAVGQHTSSVVSYIQVGIEVNGAVTWGDKYYSVAVGWKHFNVPRAVVNPGDSWAIRFYYYEYNSINTLDFGLNADYNDPYNDGCYHSNDGGSTWSKPTGYEFNGCDLRFVVYDSYNTAVYTSREYDSGCIDDVFDWGAFAAVASAAGCTLTWSIGTYTGTGTAWASIPAGQKETIASGGTPTIARKRYTKVRLDITATGTNGMPSVTSHTVNYALTGSFISVVKDLGTTPLSWGILSPIQTLPSGTSVAYYTNTSADNNIWEGWVLVDAQFQIFSTLNRYFKFKAVPSTNDGNVTPQVDSVTLYYDTGSGSTEQQQTMPFDLRHDGSLFTLEHSLSDEYSGMNELYTKVTVKTSPYFLQSTEKVWEANVPFNLINGVEQRFDCELADPCSVGANMKLYINAYTFTGGTESQVDMDVTFTKNPRVITVVITPKANVTVTAMYIDAQPYRQTGTIQSISEAAALLKAKYGARDYAYENEYIYVKATADKIAANLLAEFQEPKIMLDQGVSIQYCPGLELEALVRITDSNSGVNANYEIIGYTHTIDRNGNARTQLQAAEVVT